MIRHKTKTEICGENLIFFLKFQGILFLECFTYKYQLGKVLAIQIQQNLTFRWGKPMYQTKIPGSLSGRPSLTCGPRKPLQTLIANHRFPHIFDKVYHSEKHKAQIINHIFKLFEALPTPLLYQRAPNPSAKTIILPQQQIYLLFQGIMICKRGEANAVKSMQYCAKYNNL